MFTKAVLVSVAIFLTGCSTAPAVKVPENSTIVSAIGIMGEPAKRINYDAKITVLYWENDISSYKAVVFVDNLAAHRPDIVRQIDNRYTKRKY